MKKFVPVLCAVALSTAMFTTLIGCSSSTESSGTTENTAEQTEEATPATKTVNYEDLTFQIPEDFKETSADGSTVWLSPDGSIVVNIMSAPMLGSAYSTIEAFPSSLGINDAGSPTQSTIDGRAVAAYDNLESGSETYFLRGFESNNLIIMIVQGNSDNAEEMKQIVDSCSF